MTAAAFDRGGTHCALALGDGTLRIGARAEPQWLRVEAHDGAVLALAQDVRPGGFMSGGDDGAFRRTSAAGEVAEIASLGGKWVEHVASHADAEAGLLACAAGKFVHVFDADGERLKALAHPSTVTGLAFDARGKRVGASHVNGASLWFVAAKTDTPRLLEWKGSHIGIAIGPDGDAVVTAMQENALHGWRLSDGQHMRMSGYPAKTRSMGFTRNGKWLASSGAESVVLWPFFGGGPMGKPPPSWPAATMCYAPRSRAIPAWRRSRPASATGWWWSPKSDRAVSCRCAVRDAGRFRRWPGARKGRCWRSAPSRVLRRWWISRVAELPTPCFADHDDRRRSWAYRSS